MSRAFLVLDTPTQRQKAIHWINIADNGVRVEFKKPRRSNDQNAKMWACLTDVAQQTTHHGIKLTPDDWKLLFLDALKREVRMIPNLDGNGIVSLGRSSSDLSKEEMSDLIELIHEFGARNGVTFHNTNDESPADPSTADDKAAEAETLQSSAADESSSQAADPAGGNSGDEPEKPSADLRLSDEDRAWLKVTTRMLWAATAVGEQDLLAATFKGARENHTPDSISKAARDRGNSIYLKCKLVCFGEKDAGETLEAIALVACVEPREIVS